jgi:hypothetical protein
MKPPVQYAMMPPRVDAPKVGKMKPVEQPKVAKMRGIDAALDYYLGPTGIPDRLAALNSMLNPVETLGGSMRASQRMLAPDTAPMGRVQAAGDMLSGVAGFAAPMVAASKVGVPAASAVADAFTGLSTGAQKAGATVVDRLNQPGPMPTLYSNPIPGLMGPKKGIKVYHGSPHSFDKFSMDKIGTGEGAQAYGHGLYFAENEGVARAYRDSLSAQHAAPNADPMRAIMARTYIEQANGDLGSAKQLIRSDFESLLRDNPIRDARDRKAVESLRERMEEEVRLVDEVAKQKGSMYEVQINADPADFLDWHSLVGELPENARAPLDGLATPEERAAIARELYGSDDLFGRTWTPEEIAQIKAESDMRVPVSSAYWRAGLGPLAYRGQNMDSVASAAAAAKLRDAGIPGIKYFDAGSRGEGGGSRNYVVFDDSLIDIIRKYGIAGLMMGGMMQPNQAQAGQ